MDIVIGSAGGKAPIWDHFLLQDFEVKIKYIDDKYVAPEVKLQRVAGKYNWTLLPGVVSFDLTLQASFRFSGTAYPLLKIVQTFGVASGAEPTITPLRWQKLRPDQAVGLAKGIPATHPLLSVTGRAITVDIDFVDISRLFNDIHGNTPWYMAIDLLKGIRTILFHRSFPVDIRHNAKIFREKLAVWATRRLR